MKNLFIFILSTLFTVNLIAQDWDKLMTNKQIDCSDISYNCSVYFVKYIDENKLDSAKIILNYWESKCGVSEPVYRANILLSLLKGDFSDSFINESTMNQLLNFKSRLNIIKFSTNYIYDEHASYYGYIPAGQIFDKFTKNLASKLLNKYDSNSDEFLFVEFYSDSNEDVFSKIQLRTSKSSKLRTEYEQMVKEYVALPEAHMSWITGAWIPTGQLIPLGVHPELGFQIGIKHKKMNYDLTTTFKFMDAVNPYYAYRNGLQNDPELTNLFFGGYIGFDVGRDVFVKKGHELQLISGIALDGFDALPEDSGEYPTTKSTFSYNFNLGFGYRYYITNSFYIGLRAKYNIVDYTLNNVVNISGNPITIQFVIGGVNNVSRTSKLKKYQYKLRK